MKKSILSVLALSAFFLNTYAVTQTDKVAHATKKHVTNKHVLVKPTAKLADEDQSDDSSDEVKGDDHGSSAADTSAE